MTAGPCGRFSGSMRPAKSFTPPADRCEATARTRSTSRGPPDYATRPKFCASEQQPKRHAAQDRRVSRKAGYTNSRGKQDSDISLASAPARPRATARSARSRFKSLRRGGVLGALQLALAPDRSGDEHDDDAEDSEDHLAAMPAIGELRHHAERLEEPIEADTDRT